MVFKTIILPILLSLAGLFMMLVMLAEDDYQSKILYGVMTGFFFVLLLVVSMRL